MQCDRRRDNSQEAMLRGQNGWNGHSTAVHRHVTSLYKSDNKHSHNRPYGAEVAHWGWAHSRNDGVTPRTRCASIDVIDHRLMARIHRRRTRRQRASNAKVSRSSTTTSQRRLNQLFTAQDWQNQQICIPLTTSRTQRYSLVTSKTS